jgi:PhoH-like ATPase
MDPSVKLLTLTGRAGCGKTLIALAAGLDQLQSIGQNPIYQKLIVSRPVQPVGRDIGFLPGTLEEKMEPWIAPIRDNLEFLLGNSGVSKKNQATQKKKRSEESIGGFKDPYLDLMQQRGLIELEAISFIRGRSIPNAFIIIDEAQNLSMHELKTIVTRAGEGTKIVLTGDVEQIDNVHVDTFTNGLTYAVEKFKEYDLSGHVTLLKGERSALATLASQIL